MVLEPFFNGKVRSSKEQRETVWMHNVTSIRTVERIDIYPSLQVVLNDRSGKIGIEWDLIKEPKHPSMFVIWKDLHMGPRRSEALFN
jgi:hypothetical protein